MCRQCLIYKSLSNAHTLSARLCLRVDTFTVVPTTPALVRSEWNAPPVRNGSPVSILFRHLLCFPLVRLRLRLRLCTRLACAYLRISFFKWHPKPVASYSSSLILGFRSFIFLATSNCPGYVLLWMHEPGGLIARSAAGGVLYDV